MVAAFLGKKGEGKWRNGLLVFFSLLTPSYDEEFGFPNLDDSVHTTGGFSILVFFCLLV